MKGKIAVKPKTQRELEELFDQGLRQGWSVEKLKEASGLGIESLCLSFEKFLLKSVSTTGHSDE